MSGYSPKGTNGGRVEVPIKNPGEVDFNSWKHSSSGVAPTFPPNPAVNLYPWRDGPNAKMGGR